MDRKETAKLWNINWRNKNKWKRRTNGAKKKRRNEQRKVTKEAEKI